MQTYTAKLINANAHINMTTDKLIFALSSSNNDTKFIEVDYEIDEADPRLIYPMSLDIEDFKFKFNYFDIENHKTYQFMIQA